MLTPVIRVPSLTTPNSPSPITSPTASLCIGISHLSLTCNSERNVNV